MWKLLTLSMLFLMSLQGFGQSWKALYDSTEIYWDKDWGKCVALLEEALPLAAEDLSPTSKNYLVLMNDLGLAYLESGDYTKAKSLFVDLVELKKDLLGINSAEYAASLVNLAGIYQDLGELDQAEALFLEAIANYKVSLGDQHPDFATAVQHLGQLYESQARYTQAEALYLNAINIRKFAIGSFHPNYAGSLFSLGRLYRKTGDYDRSKEYFEQALNIYEKSYGQLHPNYANATGELGVLMQSMGQYTLAEAYLVQTIKLRKNIYGTQHRQVAEAMNNLASLYRVMGNFENAEENYRKAEEIFAQTLGNQNPDYATVLNNLGDFYVAVMEFEKARPYYQKALEIFERVFGPGHPLYANGLNNLASLNRKTGNFKEAEELYIKTLEVDEQTVGKNHPAYATSLNNLAILYVATRKYDKAEPLYLESIRIKESTLGNNHPAYAKSVNNLALLYMTKEEFFKAEPLFLEAISNQLNQISTIFPALTEKEREAFYNTLRSDLERFNTFAVLHSLDNPLILGEMFNNQLSTKALLFNASDKMRNTILQSNDQQMINDFGHWRDLREKLARLYQLPKVDLVKKELEMQDLEKEVEQLEKSLSQRSAVFAKETDRRKLTWKDVRDNLEENEAAVEIIRFRRYKIDPEGNSKITKDLNVPEFLNYGFTDEVFYAALIVDKSTVDHPRLVLLENGQDLETRYLSYYKNAIHYVVNDGNSYQQYWKKIGDNIADGTNTVYLSPDGVYNKINLNAILNPNTGKYLIDDLGIIPITSTRDLTVDNQPGKDGGSLVLLGNPDFTWEGVEAPASVSSQEIEEYLDPLPGTSDEVQSIAKLMTFDSWSPELYVGGEAREEVLKELQSPRVLHIATHGYFSDEVLRTSRHNDYLNSGLMLAGASNTLYYRRNQISFSPEEDGVLTAYEAMNLNLDHTELVVLSACETGLGTVKNGEGVYGLQRAFKVAGAKSVVQSLWRVDDRTTQKLLYYFYQGWMKHHDKHKAFKDAQLKLREEYLYPYYWAAFIMVGD
jgi:CHAT domain-containing protein/Tfp pilus assembly protein PilF